LKGRSELTPKDVKKLVLESIKLIENSQKELDVPICKNLKGTRKRLRNGTYKAEPFLRKLNVRYLTAHGSFNPPSTITLDSRLPFSDRPLDIPEIPHTLSYYTAIHEFIHADDYTGGDQLLIATTKHILSEHEDKLMKGMKIIESQGVKDYIGNNENLACLWAIQYVDMATHYRTYVVFRHSKFPRLDFIWSRLENDFFPPQLFTHIEREKDSRYIFENIIGKAGEYCLIDALSDFTDIGEKCAGKYTV